MPWPRRFSRHTFLRNTSAFIARRLPMLRIGVALFVVVCLSAVDLTVAPDRLDGIYQPGEAVTWNITTKDQTPEGLTYTVRSGGTVVLATGSLTFTAGTATVTATLAQPGTLLLTIPHDGRQSAGGAAYAWERIPVSAPEPADFEEFWHAKLAELAAVPANPVLEPVASGDDAVSLWKITMGNIRGSSIRGYLARPVGDAPCPAMLVVQWATVYPLDQSWSVGPAKNGWMVLNLIAHDLPIDQPKEFYRQQADGPLKNYTAIGREDRETSYFLRMYLSCFRGADYLTTRPDWNHQTLLVQGISQGGLQAIVTAGMHPAVTMVTANVPAGCDQTGAAIGRAPGWPQREPGWSSNDERTMTASTYYDVVNFARRVRCPVLVGMGLIDTTCPPAGVFAMVNQIITPKRVVIMPRAGHNATNGAHRSYFSLRDAWWNAAKDGSSPPLH